LRIDRVKFAAALASNDIKVYELASMTGLSRATISGIKSGKGCSKDTADKLVAVLGQNIIVQREER